MSVEVWGTHTESVRWEAGEWGGYRIREMVCLQLPLPREDEWRGVWPPEAWRQTRRGMETDSLEPQEERSPVTP